MSLTCHSVELTVNFTGQGRRSAYSSQNSRERARLVSRSQAARQHGIHQGHTPHPAIASAPPTHACLICVQHSARSPSSTWSPLGASPSPHTGEGVAQNQSRPNGADAYCISRSPAATHTAPPGKHASMRCISTSARISKVRYRDPVNFVDVALAAGRGTAVRASAVSLPGDCTKTRLRRQPAAAGRRAPSVFLVHPGRSLRWCASGRVVSHPAASFSLVPFCCRRCAAD